MVLAIVLSLALGATVASMLDVTVAEWRGGTMAKYPTELTLQPFVVLSATSYAVGLDSRTY